MSSTKVVSSKILVYQDEDCTILVDYLVHNGFDVITSTKDNIFGKIQEKNYDLCILSHYREENSLASLKLLKYLRKTDEKTPVIMVSDKAQYTHIIEAFDEGADDYIIRPYNLDELVRRVKAILKRCGIRVKNIELCYNIGNYLFSTKDKTITINNTKIQLTNKQSQVLTLLCAYKNEILPKKLIMQYIWSSDNHFNKRSLDVHICMLRNALKMDSRISIETMRGIGYSLAVNENEDLM